MGEPLSPRWAGLLSRSGAFLVERFPWAAPTLWPVLAAAVEERAAQQAVDAEAIESLRQPVRVQLDQALRESERGLAQGRWPETSPGVSVTQRLEQAREELLTAIDGFFRRAAIAASLTAEERRELLFGMILTRALDNRLKSFFISGEVRYGNTGFQGKGFRSLGQEAIYAAPLRLRRGASYCHTDGWQGDVVAPMIRDVGAALAMRPDGETVRQVLNAQMGKAGPPMQGKDLHIGDLAWGILPPAAPLSISSLNIAGIAWAMAREQVLAPNPAGSRVAVAFIGEGGTSLGEWHEAINACAVHRLPAIFCVQNNQTALSTPVTEQSAVRVFADKAAGYGIPGITLDGTDPEAIAAAFAWAAERARAGCGPTLIELVAMRMCGHAHHDDMLYLGHDPQPSWDYPELLASGYADPEAFAHWAARDPLERHAERLEAEGVISATTCAAMKEQAQALVEAEARTIITAPWPAPELAGAGVFADAPPLVHVEVLEQRLSVGRAAFPALPALTPGLPPDPRGRTLLEAVMLGVGDALRADPRVFVYGEDVGGKYGNAFLLLRPLLAEFGARICNSPLSEAGTLGVAIGAALLGQRPIAEIQFNDFIATGFNQLVNNAAKIRYRWGGSVPLVVRMPWGGLRHAGPYHSQNTEPWFYRTPGLKIVVPSTPEDARALLAAAVADPDPVLFYEHIALYRDPKIKQLLPVDPPSPLPLGQAALRRAGSDLAIISYGAFVHLALRVADALAQDGIAASVLDLRSLVPLDRTALLAVAAHCGKVLLLNEDSRRGSIGESLAAILQEELFEFLDAPIRVIGALDTPVPYSPPLEAAFLPSFAQIERAARLLVAY